ncbi:uncharacterized protein LOC143919465 isoform X2 [Arctopsyche grandis]|uniref:uncharacterized protein LOC143919465 isoform X2 n=1 Tax=Arctopsyche grandis TaxID=121162 RepID=UPI00406D7AD3
MELLQEIDWLKTVYDGRKFLKHDDILNEAATFKIIREKFKNPLLPDSDEETRPVKKLQQKLNKTKSEPPKDPKKPNQYIPGLRQIPIFPQVSTLTPHQHKICITAIQSIKNYCVSMPKINFNPNQLQIYNNLIGTINEENRLFAEHVKNIWITKSCVRYLKILPEHEMLIDKVMKKSVNVHKKYPQFYQMACMFPLVYNNNDVPIEISFLEDLLEVGELPTVKIPYLNKKFVLPTTLYNSVDGSKDAFKFHNCLVSEDIKCEELSIKHGASIVISSNGLKVLANNQAPFTQFWDLPILVKSYPTKGPRGELTYHTVAFIDKSLPVCNFTNHEKSLRCYKLLLKSSFLNLVQHQNQTSSENVPNTSKENEIIKTNDEPECSTESNTMNDLSSDSSSDEEKLLIDCALGFDDKTTKTTTKIGKTKNALSKISQNMTSNNKNEDENKQSARLESEKISVIDKNIEQKNRITTYKLWKIGQTKGKNPLCKDLEKDIKIVIRCKVDGYETDPSGEKQNINIVPKLEYQAEYGAEMTTPSEIAQHWTLLQFRPNSTLLKARIIPHTGEIIMIEKLPLSAVASEASKRGVWKSEFALGAYFSIFSRLSKLQPGQYILRHEPKHHAFALLYRSVPSKCENGLDLSERTSDETSINQTAPWTPIDPNIVTPNLAHHNIMPCMFTSGKCKILKPTFKKKIIKPKMKKKNKKKSSKKQNDKKKTE